MKDDPVAQIIDYVLEARIKLFSEYTGKKPAAPYASARKCLLILVRDVHFDDEVRLNPRLIISKDEAYTRWMDRLSSKWKEGGGVSSFRDWFSLKVVVLPNMDPNLAYDNLDLQKKFQDSGKAELQSLFRPLGRF
jgi:hypothetical protein